MVIFATTDTIRAERPSGPDAQQRRAIDKPGMLDDMQIKAIPELSVSPLGELCKISTPLPGPEKQRSLARGL
jgi:hypothetical protein